MTHVQRSALLPFPANKIYDLVNDVDSYPEFVPWCVRCEVQESNQYEKKATMYFASRGIKASVTTRNELIENKEIIIHLISGPFKHLTGDWNFHCIDENSCKVELDMQYTFSNRLYEITIGPIFNQVASKLVSAFTQRAMQLYGK